jgi:hypothetical protein
MSFVENVPTRELHVAGLNLVVALAFAILVLVHPAVSAGIFIRLVAQYMLLTAALSLLALLCFALLHLRTTGMATALRERWREDRMVTLLWPMFLFALVMPTFSAFKQRILPLAGFTFDPTLAGVDRAMFGVNPGVWLHQAVGSPMLTYFLDAIYHAWFVPMSVGVGIVALCTDARTRAQYMTAYTMTWIGLGSALAYLLPAAGPCFWHALVGQDGGAPFDAVNSALIADRAAHAPHFLFTLEIKSVLLQRFDDPDLSIGGGISAIPSIHNAMAVLFALVGYRFNRTFGLCMSAFAALIWIGSIYLNWHYAIDGVVGAAGAILLWFGAGLITGQNAMIERPAPASRLVPYPDTL